MRWLQEVLNFVSGLPSAAEVDGALRDPALVYRIEKRRDVGVALGYSEEERVEHPEPEDMRLMHQPVGDRLFRAVVLGRADVEALARKFGCSEHTARARFVTSDDEVHRRPSYRPAKRERHNPRAAAQAKHLSKPVSFDEVILALRQNLSPEKERDRCGFDSAQETMALSCVHHLAEVTVNGLNRTALSAGYLQGGNPAYFEVYIMERSGSVANAHCGITIGLANKRQCQENATWGLEAALGFCCNGDVNSGMFTRTHDYNFYPGDTVGLLVTNGHDAYSVSAVSSATSNASSCADDQELAPSPASNQVGHALQVTLFINGRKAHQDPVSFWSEGTGSLHAAVTLSRVGVKAEMRCCPSDMMQIPWQYLPQGTLSLSGVPLAPRKDADPLA